MTAFIRQEALEKAREIQLKADEEFAIEKSKLVREETSSIDKEYEKKFKQASMSQQITRSTMSNKTRLKVLSARQSLLDDLFEQTRDKVGKAAEGKNYDAILKGLILEGMYMLNEKKLIIRCRKADKSKVEKASKEAGEEYKETMGNECETTIDEKNMLPDDSYVIELLITSSRQANRFCRKGGVFVAGSGGRIELDNTFEARLKLCETDALPSARVTLFGENDNRKFHD